MNAQVQTHKLVKAADPLAVVLAKISAELSRDPRAGMTPAQRKRDFAESQVQLAKSTIANLRESVAFTARTWGWSGSAAHMVHRGHTLAALRLAAVYRRNAAEAFAEARKLGAF